MFLYFLIDTSGSMDGAKIQSVNDTMENVLSELKLHSDKLNMLINVLSFARKSKWMFKQPIQTEEIKWNRMYASGMTSLGNACKQLASNIDKYVEHEEVTIVFLSDGSPTDDFDEGLDKLNKCLANKNSNRYAIALEGADIITLNRFTDNADNVFLLESLDELMELILSSINISQFNHHHTETNNDDDEWA